MSCVGCIAARCGVEVVLNSKGVSQDKHGAEGFEYPLKDYECIEIQRFL